MEEYRNLIYHCPKMADAKSGEIVFFPIFFEIQKVLFNVSGDNFFPRVLITLTPSSKGSMFIIYDVRRGLHSLLGLLISVDSLTIKV